VVEQMDAQDVQPVGPRQPCPCGSGRRYKACHGRSQGPTRRPIVVRPFAGLPQETDWVALREVVPSATAPLTLRADSERKVTLVTVLPLAWPALVRADGEILLALQTSSRGADPSRDLAQALLAALDSEPGNGLSGLGEPGDGPRLQELITDDGLDVTVHDGFEWWLGDVPAEAGSDAAVSLEQANASVVPTVRLTAAPAAYWCRIGERCHLRWVLPYDEEPLLDALARLAARGELGLGEGTKYVGAFRALGLVIPVWDLPVPAAGQSVQEAAAEVEEPLAGLAARLEVALAESGPLDSAARRARAGVVSRQVTLR
jgi:hypothetical protein